MNTESLIKNLKDKIQDFEAVSETSEVGQVVEISDGIAKISGLNHCQMSEMLSFEDGSVGIALNLDEYTVGAIIIGEYSTIKEGDVVKRTNTILSIPVGDELVGRVVDSLARPLDGKGAITKTADYFIERMAPGVMEREEVNQPLSTGIKSIDALIPIGRGQRELIIGDRQTGKTTVAIDTILNQKGTGTLCVYVAIGQKKSNTARILNTLKEGGALAYTAVVLAGSSDGPALSYLAPYAGVAIAEYFMDQGRDVLVVYDDLSKHAASYREISLLLRRPPGREAYPGDVFFLHSRLLERAARRNSVSGGGSITALPIVETQAGDISQYIPTNVISITDGQIFLESELFHKGVRPAINVGLSVSRVGGAAQIKSMKKTSGKIKLSLAQFRELEAFSQFSSDLDEETKKILSRGRVLTEILKQPQYSPVQTGVQVAIIYAANNGYLDDVQIEELEQWEKDFSLFLQSSKEEVLKDIEKSWDEEIEVALKNALEEFTRIRK